MKIIWIVDNKYRELVGLHNIKSELKKQNIDLILIHKFNWKSAINFYNPSYILVPNLSKNFGEKIILYAKKKKIFVISYLSEGLDYSNEFMDKKYNKNVLKKIDYFFLWSELEKKYLRKKIDISKKNSFLVGNLKFKREKFFKSKKIKNVGILSSTKLITSRFNDNIVEIINNRDKKNDLLNQIVDEINYTKILVQIKNELKKKQYNIFFKTHPFENSKKYNKLFDKQMIFNGSIREFSKKIDIVINLYSSSALECLLKNIPIISLEKFQILNNKRLGKILSTKIGLKPKNLMELLSLLKIKKEILLKRTITNNIMKEIKNNVDFTKTEIDFVQSFLKLQRYETKKNYLHIFNYIISEIKVLIFYRRDTLFRSYSYFDQKLFKKFSS